MADPQIAQLTAEMANLARAMREVVDSSSRTVAAQNAQRQSSLEQRIEMDEFTKSLTQGNVLGKQEMKLVKEAIQLKKKEQQAAKEYARLAKISNDLDRKKKVSQAEQERAAKNAALALGRWRDAQDKTSKVQTQLLGGTSNVSQGMSRLTGTSSKANVALAWFGATLREQGAMLLAQNRANGGIVEGTNTLIGALAEQQNVALKYRVTGEELAKISAANRQTINSMGGTAKTLEQLDPTITQFQILTGDATEALRLAVDTASDFAKKGIRPTTDVMVRYTEDLKDLQRRTGMNTAAAAKYFDELASDTDTIDLLRSARKEEREAILQSQRALITQALAAGQSAEQAKEAAKMLNKMVAAKPLDRLKQAAKVRALSGAMGIGGGEEAAQAIIAGKRATAEQQKALQRFSQNAANAMDQAAGQDIGTEIFATTLLDKLDLEQYYGKGSSFSTTLGDTLKPAIGDLSKAYIDATQTQTGQLVNWLSKLYDQLGLILSGKHWGGLIASGVAAIGAWLFKGKLAEMLASATGITAAEAAGGAAGAAGAGAAGAGKAAGALSKLAAVGKVAGVAGAALDVGFGVNDLLDGKRQTEMHKGWEMLSPMRWGMYGGEKINQGAESLMGGQSIGSKLYDMIHGDDEVKKMLAPMPVKPKAAAATAKQAEAVKKTADASDDIKTATMQSASSLADQVKKLDASNDFLKRIADLAEQQLNLTERQLVAMTMTEKERTSDASKMALRRDTKFGSQYNYA